MPSSELLVSLSVAIFGVSCLVALKTSNKPSQKDVDDDEPQAAPASRIRFAPRDKETTPAFHDESVMKFLCLPVFCWKESMVSGERKGKGWQSEGTFRALVRFFPLIIPSCLHLLVLRLLANLLEDVKDKAKGKGKGAAGAEKGAARPCVVLMTCTDVSAVCCFSLCAELCSTA